MFDVDGCSPGDGIPTLDPITSFKCFGDRVVMVLSREDLRLVVEAKRLTFFNDRMMWRLCGKLTKIFDYIDDMLDFWLNLWETMEAVATYFRQRRDHFEFFTIYVIH